MRQEAFDQLVEWLTDINGLSNEELAKFANNSFSLLLQDSGRTIEALMHILLDVYYDEEVVQPALEQLLAAYYRGGPLRIFALQYVPTLIRCYLTAVSMKTRSEVIHLEAFFLAIYNEEIVDKPSTSAFAPPKKEKVNMFGLPIRSHNTTEQSSATLAEANKLKRKVEQIRVPCMTQSSIYHDPNKISQSILFDSALLSRLTPPSSSCADLRMTATTTITISIGPYQLYPRMTVENRFLILTRLMRSKMIMNTEWGAFAEGHDGEYLLSEFDQAVDAISTHPKEYIFDKLVAGMYLGELVRFVLLRLTERGVIFSASASTATRVLKTHNSFPSKYITSILRDDTPSLENVDAVLKKSGIIDKSTAPTDSVIVRHVCHAISERSAALVAACIASIVQRLGLSRVTVGIDGSLFSEHPHYDDMLRDRLDSLLGPATDVCIVQAGDGSGRGAALVAAVAQQMQL